ncbi:hypothetical protein CsSME_00021065 [Camellia sinensis var. sinensis]
MHGFEKLSTTSKGDIEEGTLYPGLGYGENQLRWGFIRKVYGILAAQLVLTTVVSSITVLYPPVTDLLKGNSGLFLFLLFLPLILLWPLYVYQQKHPLNLIILGLFTMCLSLTVGVSCANTDGRIVLEALILTSAVVVSLTGYTFWASKKGKDFSYLGPILFTSLFTLFLAGFIQEPEQRPIRPISLYLEGPSRTGKTAWARSLGRHNYFSGRISFKDYDQDAAYNVIDDIKYSTVPTELMKNLVGCQRDFHVFMFFPLGSTSTAIYGGIGAVIFSGYIVYDTDNLIKRFTYEEHIWASVTLYLDILNLFLTILRILRSSDN